MELSGAGRAENAQPGVLPPYYPAPPRSNTPPGDTYYHAPQLDDTEEVPLSCSGFFSLKDQVLVLFICSILT